MYSSIAPQNILYKKIHLSFIACGLLLYKSRNHWYKYTDAYRGNLVCDIVMNLTMSKSKPTIRFQKTASIYKVSVPLGVADSVFYVLVHACYIYYILEL
jgi:hypothetical protein